MGTRIQKWGNSLGVRLPQKILREAELREGCCVNIKRKKRLILIESCTYELANLGNLVRKINAKNIHREAGWGNSYGKEIW